MQKIWLISLALLVIVISIFIVWLGVQKDIPLISPGGTLTTEKKLKEKPLEKYSFDNLSQRKFVGSEIRLGRILEDKEAFTSYIFAFMSDGKTVSGLANIPKVKDKQQFPVIIMLRGYVDQEIYKTGVGTQRAGEVLAENGFITLAPDFLGFGDSDMPEDNVFWERFDRPVQVLNLIASIPSLSQADSKRLGIWAHSNGGQIALSLLEITGQAIPTILWAPVSKPFPYSILYYTDEAEDEGKALRKEIAGLEEDYDVHKFSITNYLDKIKAPIQIHQGGADDAVPQSWSDNLVEKLQALKVEVIYYIYPQADHNMVGSWDTVVTRDLKFFKEKLKIAE